MFTQTRKNEICRQIMISNIFDEFHNKKLYTRDKLVTSYKQALAMALSISNKKCLNLNSVNKNLLDNLEVDDLLRLIKTKELIKLVKTDSYSKKKNIDTKDIKKLKTKKDIYKKYFNKPKFINKLIYYLKK